MKRRGSTLVELLVGLILATVLGGAFFTYITGMYASSDTVNSTNRSISQTRRPLDTLADHLRNAQSFTESGTYYSAITDGQPTEITYRTGLSQTDTVRYWLDGTVLKRTDDAGTTVVASGVSALNFTYWLATKYNAATFTSPAATTLASGELAIVSAVEINLTMSVDGQSRVFTTVVKLRNSPKKTGV